MTDREKIISLAKECGIGYDYATYPCISFDTFQAFYHAAQKEAFEQAAQVCDKVNNYDNPMTANDCADAIRQLIKE